MALLKTFALPESSSSMLSDCSYCGVTTDNNCGSVQVTNLEWINACKKHHALATRDARAAMDRLEIVPWYVIHNNPLFAALPARFIVRRSNGDLDNDWSIMTVASYRDMRKIWRYKGAWSIKATNPEDVTKAVPIIDFKLSLPVEQHHLVDDLISLLDEGVFHAEAVAFGEATGPSRGGS